MELLVVIGILVLLAGVTMPAISSVLAEARRANCVSNLRQIGLGLAAYRNQYDGAVPDVQTLPVDKRSPTIMSALSEFVPVGDIWWCPSDPTLFAEVGTSYEYFMGFFMAMASSRPAIAEQRKNELLQMLDANSSLVYIISDAEDFHPGGPDGVARQSVFLDGHVDWFHAPGGEKKQDKDERAARKKQAEKTK